jgi:hypothetical protein
MSDILADYREWRDQQAARVSTHSGGCHMWHRDCMIHRLADALERARLTDAEREAVDTAEASLMRESTDRNTPEPVRQRFAAAVNTLRGLLERTRNGSPDGCETVR